MSQPPYSALPTRALYHEDSPSLTFSSVVMAVQGHEVALDATAFYPEGGGQSSDVGQLGWSGTAAEVTAVRKEKASGVIWHALSADPPAPGSRVEGVVDADVRWRHMQRHSGEHLLAQAFARVSPTFEVAAVSMRGPECTLDLRGEPAESHVRAAEALLRRTLGRTDLRLHTPIVPESDLGRYPLRRETKVRGQVRLVVFQGEGGEPFDVSACGGTHVPRASMAAPVVILRTEKQKAGLTRVVFMAGEEASAFLAGVYRDARSLAQGFSVPVTELPGRVAALQAERDVLRTEADDLRGNLAAALLAAQPPQTVQGLLLRDLTVGDAALLLPLLSRVPEGSVLTVSTPAGRCGVASAHAGVDAGQVLRLALARTGGKGGGRPELAQGQTADPEAFGAAVQAVLAGEKPGQHHPGRSET
ncbi:alanyl-tRNA editing protein [Deinococcus navajonensis]|uniref:Alanine--tRNA ligase-related protein n=1 Tax=Deinococcus navajonensis TaxID=309884 RepID=A0ABV8XPD3_9DEIO